MNLARPDSAFLCANRCPAGITGWATAGLRCVTFFKKSVGQTRSKPFPPLLSAGLPDVAGEPMAQFRDEMGPGARSFRRRTPIIAWADCRIKMCEVTRAGERFALKRGRE